MLMILVNWLYMAITTYLVGYALLGLFARLFQYRIKRQLSYFFAGLLGVTVYAEMYSLFGGVGLLANVLLMIACAGIVLLNGKKIYRQMKDACEKCRENGTNLLLRLALSGCLVLLFAYGTSRGYMHFDTGLYHAQSIRWIEEYGVVPGLANLQSRFAYNSAAFALTALYSMKDLFSQSCHATAGFFALLSAFLACDLSELYTKQKWRLSHFVRLGLIFYLGVIFGEMMSPASDYYAQLLIFDILILWLEQDEIQEQCPESQSVTPYCLLCILLVYAVTIKFSVGLLLLLVLKPALWLIKKKDGRQIAVSILCGIFVLFPFLTRNVIISGWLIYPSTAIDLFSVDWKIPEGQARLDALEIGAYGKGLNDVAKWQTPFKEWCPVWFQNLKSLEKLFVLGALASVIILFLLFVFYLVKKEKADWNFILVASVFSLAAGFWFLSAPLVRYGYAYLITLPLLVFGYLIIKAAEDVKIQRYRLMFYNGFRLLALLFLISRIPGLYEDISRTVHEPYYIVQRDYDRCKAEKREIDGITFYVPLEHGQIGYELFPSSLFANPVELRGEGLKDGFRQVK